VQLVSACRSADMPRAGDEPSYSAHPRTFIITHPSALYCSKYTTWHIIPQTEIMQR